MRRLLLVICFTLLSTDAFSYGNVLCVNAPTGGVTCYADVNRSLFTDAESATAFSCRQQYPNAEFTICNHPAVGQTFQNLCVAVFTNSANKPFYSIQRTEAAAKGQAFASCVNSESHGFSCTLQVHACDGSGIPLAPVVATTPVPAAPLTNPHKYVSVACGRTTTDPIVCALAEASITKDEEIAPITAEAMKKCQQAGILDCRFYSGYSGACHGIAATPDGRVSEAFGYDVEQARIGAFRACNTRYQTSDCRGVIAFCANLETASAVPPSTSTSSPPTTASAPSRSAPTIVVNGISPNAATIILSLASVLGVILLYAGRAPIINFVIHGNLAHKLPVYGEDIQVLFKRTQRVNWYGRVVFGIVARLAMTHQQLADVRRYWLGRVVAFDSLRRERQNQLAVMHMQLAAKAKSEAHDKKSFWSRRWATLRSFLTKLFWIFIAVINLFLGLFFVRVTIAKLVRGKLVESKDLTLILQAKDAIEDSSKYLKEYLTTAATFDGREEMFEPE